MKAKPRTLDRTFNLDPEDLRSLLAADPERLLGLIMRLNRAPRYHNSLNAIVLLYNLEEMRLSAQRAKHRN